MAKRTSKAGGAKKTTKSKASKKKTASKKKAAATRSSKAPSKASGSKKTTKKTGTKKTTKSSASGSKKVATTKKSTTSKKTKSSSKSSSAKSGSSRSGKPAKDPSSAKEAKGKDSSAPRFRRFFAENQAGGSDAAQKLAKLAGLRPVESVSEAASRKKRFKKITESPFKPEELAEFRLILREKRAELFGDVSSFETEALTGGSGGLSHTPQHLAEQGSDAADQFLNLNLAAGGRKVLKEIDDAIERIDKGVFGVCELLGKPIKRERLENTPWARYSIEAARMIEDNPHILRGNDDDDDDEDDAETNNDTGSDDDGDSDD